MNAIEQPRACIRPHGCNQTQVCPRDRCISEEKQHAILMQIGRGNAPQVPCQCGVRPASACPGAWEKGCDLGSNPEHVRAVDPSAQVETLMRSPVAQGADAYMVKGLPTGRLAVILPEEFELVTQAFPDAVIAPLFLSLPEATAEPAAPEEPEEPGFVRMPRSQEEAINMLCVGHAWLAARNPRIAAMTPAEQEREPLTRFCPGCGSVGPVGAEFRDCCPDGGHARTIPESLAHKCRDLFQLAIEQAKVQAGPTRDDAYIVRQTEELAAALCEWRFGGKLKGEYRNSENPRGAACWAMACKVQEMLTDTDPEDAVANLDGEVAQEVAHLMQDTSRPLFDALARDPNARQHVRDAAQGIEAAKVTDPGDDPRFMFRAHVLPCLRPATATEPDPATDQLLTALDEASAGTTEWRVQDPESGSFCMFFNHQKDHDPEGEAHKWLADHRAKRYRYSHYEVKAVQVRDKSDDLMKAAATEIRRLVALKPTNGSEQRRACKGENCGSTDGRFHSLQCWREHEAAIGPDASSEYAVIAVTARGDEPNPVAWIRKHPDGTLTSELLTDGQIEPVRKESGAWVPLFAAVEAAPTQAAPAGLNADQKHAVQQWLDFGELMYARGHQRGYFSRTGWAYETLKGLLDGVKA